MGEGPHGRKTYGRRAENNNSRKSIIKMNQFRSTEGNSMKKYFAFFITKPLKQKNCSDSPAISENLKVLYISIAFFIRLILVLSP